MSSTEQEIQALMAAFVEDLALLVRQHTLEIVLAQLDAGASPRPNARQQVVAAANIVLRPSRPRREKTRLGKPLEPVIVRAAAEVAPEEPPQPGEATALAVAEPAGLEEPVTATP
jgi:hypothetical protein